MDTAPHVVLNHATGLSAQEVLARRREVGENRLAVSRGISPWMILLSQFKSPLV